MAAACRVDRSKSGALKRKTKKEEEDDDNDIDGDGEDEDGEVTVTGDDKEVLDGEEMLVVEALRI